MTRAIVLMMDSLGIGASTDAHRFGDEGADTFGNIAKQCAEGNVEIDGEARSSLKLPNLCALGLAHAAAASRGSWPAGQRSAQPWVAQTMAFEGRFLHAHSLP